MPSMLKRAACLLCSVAVAFGASACGTSISVVTNGLAQGPTITIGVAADQPGLGYLHGGEYSGFDISVAQYVAKMLGYAQKQVVFKQLTPAARVSALTDGSVDMVVDSFTSDDAAGKDVAVSESYLAVHGTLLVRADGTSGITKTRDANGKTVCAAKGTAVADSLRNVAAGVAIEERDTYPQCVTALMIGETDAVATDDAVAAGLASDAGDEYVKDSGATFGDDEYVIAVRQGRGELIGQINAALRSMVSDGTWRQAAETMRQRIGYKADGAGDAS